MENAWNTTVSCGIQTIHGYFTWMTVPMPAINLHGILKVLISTDVTHKSRQFALKNQKLSIISSRDPLHYHHSAFLESSKQQGSFSAAVLNKVKGEIPNSNNSERLT